MSRSAPKHLGCCCGSSPFCYPGQKQGGFSASLLQQWEWRGAERWDGFLLCVGRALLPQQSAVLLFMVTMDGVCESLVGPVLGRAMHYPMVVGRGGSVQEGDGGFGGVHLPALELCLCLNSSSLQGACQFCADFPGHRLETLCWH